MKFHIIFQTFITLAIFINSFSFAQQRDSLLSADTLKKSRELDQVVISATRSAVNIRKVPQSISLVSSKDISLTPSVDFTDLLKKNAAVNVIQYPSLLSGVGIRGFKAQQGDFNQRVLMLIDGRPSGTANLATIHPTDVERIEILKGPASALYGSQAMGGVINVITRKSLGAVRSNVFVEYGSFETLRVGGSSGGSIAKNLDYDLSFNFYNRSKNVKLGKGNLFRDLLDAETALKIYPDFTQAEVDDRRSDGLKREFTRLSYNSANLRLGYKISKNWRVDVKGERFVAENVESPSDLFYQNARPSGKDINKHNGEVSVSGKLANHQLFLRGYITNEDN
jgi:vitamin B12 transporter